MSRFPCTNLAIHVLVVLCSMILPGVFDDKKHCACMHTPHLLGLQAHNIHV